MLEWIRFRDDNTCEVYFRLYDENLMKYVATVNKPDRRYRVQILDHVPFHAKSLKVAKEVGQLIYEQTCCS